MRSPSVVRKTASSQLFRDRHPGGYVLNLGGVGMVGAVNFALDPEADVQGDAHDLSRFAADSFDMVISTGMLQYCHAPHVVASEIHRVLRPGGLLYLDAPFVQPYCDHHGIDDLWRFTKRGLLRLFGAFEVVECGSSIPAVSALGYYLSRCEGRSRYVTAAWRLAVSLVFAPLAWTKLGRSPKVAGALYLVARKPATWSEPIASGTSAAELREPSTAEGWAPRLDRVDDAGPER
jgi:SAM-dependent methyltransferase